MAFVAAEVARSVPGLNITLPRSLAKLPKLMEAVLPVLSANAIASDADVYVPRNLSAKGRARLRQMALEWRDDMLGPSDGSASRLTRSIFTSQNLKETDRPKPLTPEQRQRLKDKFSDVLSDTSFRYPYFILPAALEDHSLPTVLANVVISAVDGGDDGPSFQINKTDCLWDTGSHCTIISDDCLDLKMRKFLAEDLRNEPYVQKQDGPDGLVSKVQLSALVRMSNNIIQLDTIAVVLPVQAIPNRRSGIILGQRGTIDKISYISTPRSIMAAEGRDPGEEYWGEFDVVKYIDAEFNVVHV